MVKGPFARMKHKHLLTEVEGNTLMVDEFDYTSPLGILRIAADPIFLKGYMTRLLIHRNLVIKNIAESSTD